MHDRGFSVISIVWLLTAACSGTKTPTSASSTSSAGAPAPAAQTAFTISGTVTEQQTGHGIATALARVLDGKNANRAAVTDGSGAYVIAGLEAGDLTLEFSATGYSSLSQKISLQADTRAGAVLIAASRTITGTVTDATSRGVLPNILIVVADGPSMGSSNRSDASGNYALSGVSAASTRLQASATSYLTTNASIPIGSDVRRDIVMTRTGAPSPEPIPAPPPTAPTPPSGGVVITFDGASSVSGYTESGFTISPTTPIWFVGSYGKPGPSIQFSSAAGVSTDGEVRISNGDSIFRLVSVDVYSSTTPIPYAFTGIRNGSTVYSVAGRQGNTFGNFATVASGQSETVIDALLIRLTNPAAPCCANSVGIDNIVIAR
jgi:hypothetical protein